MFEIMENLNYLRKVVGEYKLRELSRPLNSHEFHQYKRYEEELDKLEGRLSAVDNKVKNVESRTTPSDYPLNNVDYIHMSSKEKKYLFC